ncbi:Hypothetical predicted protein [Octopus vulgaris]|uniref:Uncharacterized protein n=1 Tax=Octopus vulgaris TaxID=6645 RepID=A0AA36AZK8_OCTVU|nr:Hypothetical predicted protein [Octopus vulgaris]
MLTVSKNNSSPAAKRNGSKCCLVSKHSSLTKDSQVRVCTYVFGILEYLVLSLIQTPFHIQGILLHHTEEYLTFLEYYSRKLKVIH